jgi:hypothetical protein
VTVHLDVEDLVSIAAVVLGSPPKVRDYGLLAAVAARPAASAFGQDAYPADDCSRPAAGVKQPAGHLTGEADHGRGDHRPQCPVALDVPTLAVLSHPLVGEPEAGDELARAMFTRRASRSSTTRGLNAGTPAASPLRCWTASPAPSSSTRSSAPTLIDLVRTAYATRPCGGGRPRPGTAAPPEHLPRHAATPPRRLGHRVATKTGGLLAVTAGTRRCSGRGHRGTGRDR